MDPELYDSIKERSERGEFIDFNLPDDADYPRLSDMGKTKGPETSNEFESVDPDAIFGKMFGGE